MNTYRPYTAVQRPAPGGISYLGSAPSRALPRFQPRRTGSAAPNVSYKGLAALLHPAAPPVPAPIVPSQSTLGFMANMPDGGGGPFVVDPTLAPPPGPTSATTTDPGATAGAAPPTTPDPTDPWQNDPIYQQIIGIANEQVAQAQASATAARKQLAIQLGDPGLATSLGLGSLVAETAAANPFSTLKNLLRSHNQNIGTIDKSLNRANLYSSSTRGRQQQLEGTGYLGNIAGANASAQATLGQILSALLSAQQAAADRKQSAAGDAYRWWLDHGGGGPPPADPASGAYTQADAFAALLGNAFKRAQDPTTPQPPGGL